MALGPPEGEGRTWTRGRTSAISVWTRPEMQWSACADTCSVGPVFTSGWRPGPTGSCALCVRLASVETRSSHCMGGGVHRWIPEQKHLQDHRDRGQNQKITMGAGHLETGDSRCPSESEPFRLVSLPRLLTSMTEGQDQLPQAHHKRRRKESCPPCSSGSLLSSCSGSSWHDGIGAARHCGKH